MSFTDIDKEAVISRYTERFKDYGYSPQSLGWTKGKQGLRYDILSSQWDMRNASVLDLGCGFADLFNHLDKKFNLSKYYGIELVPALYEEAKARHADNKKVQLFQASVLDLDLETLIGQVDYVLISGLFNFKLQGSDNYEFVEEVLKKYMTVTRKGIAADFLSNKVDFQYDYTFHNDPAKIIDIAYKFSRNIVLRNDYFPFEFAVFINKDQEFDKSDTIFNSFKQRIQ